MFVKYLALICEMYFLFFNTDNWTLFILSASVVKVPILQHLESLRDEELEERREKRRQQLAEEEEAKQNERSTSAGEESREQTLQVR